MNTVSKKHIKSILRLYLAQPLTQRHLQRQHNSTQHKGISILSILFLVCTLVACQKLDMPQPSSPTSLGITDTPAKAQPITLHFALSEESSSEARALIFRGAKKRVPSIYGLSTDDTDELKIYLFSLNQEQGITTASSPYVWSLYPIGQEQANQGDTGYRIYDRDAKLRLSVNWDVEDNVISLVRNSIGQGKRWFMGAILGGHSNTRMHPQGLVYSFDTQVERRVGHNILLNTSPNKIIWEHIFEGADANAELRHIPLLTPITELTPEQVMQNNWLNSTFYPRGILLNFQLKNTTEHTISIDQLDVKSTDLAFSGHYSLLPKHLLNPQTGEVHTYPLFLSAKTPEELQRSTGLQAPSGIISFPLRAPLGGAIQLTPEQSSRGHFTLWAMPLAERSSAQADLSLNYKVLYAPRTYSYHSKQQHITIQPKQGEQKLREGLSFAQREAFPVIESAPLNIDAVTLSRWMQHLPNTTPLYRLSLVGTHDTMANTTGTLQGTWKTQGWSLKEQLEHGIRYLDIRLKRENGKFQLYHGIIRLGHEFKTGVLDVLKEFLSKNPSEFIFMTLKKEGGDGNEFREHLPKVLAQYHQQNPNLLYLPSWSSSNHVGDLRGRIVILSREGYLGMGSYISGIGDNKATDATLYPATEAIRFADVYKGSTSWEDKEKQIREGIQYALNADKERTLVLNHLSQAYFSPKWTPRTMSRHYNQYAQEQIEQEISNSRGYPIRSGFSIIDFADEAPGQALTKLIIDQCLTANSKSYRQRHGRATPSYNY